MILGLVVIMVFEKINPGIAAVPPDVRKGCAFPVTIALYSEAVPQLAPGVRGAASSQILDLHNGKAEPFRTSAGKARKSFSRIYFSNTIIARTN